MTYTWDTVLTAHARGPPECADRATAGGPESARAGHARELTTREGNQKTPGSANPALKTK